MDPPGGIGPPALRLGGASRSNFGEVEARVGLAPTLPGLQPGRFLLSHRTKWGDRLVEPFVVAFRVTVRTQEHALV